MKKCINCRIKKRNALSLYFTYVWCKMLQVHASLHLGSFFSTLILILMLFIFLLKHVRHESVFYSLHIAKKIKECNWCKMRDWSAFCRRLCTCACYAWGIGINYMWNQLNYLMWAEMAWWLSGLRFLTKVRLNCHGFESK